MVASLQDLPLELVEVIVSSLHVIDIKHLRLANRGLRYKASHGRFRTYFTTKEVDLCVPDVRDLTAQIKPGSLPCLLEHLTITGVLYVTQKLEKTLRLKTMPVGLGAPTCTQRDSNGRYIEREPAIESELSQAQREIDTLNWLHEEQARAQQQLDDVESLTVLFKSIREHGSHSQLKSITLKVVVYRGASHRLEPEKGGDWRPTWKTAAHTCAVTLQALGSSMLGVETLNLYSQIRTCSLPGFELGRMMEIYASPALDRILGNLKTVSLSTCDRRLPETLNIAKRNCDPDDVTREQGFRDLRTPGDAQVAAEAKIMALHPRNALGVSEFLQKTHSLQELDLHRYRLLTGFENTRLEYDSMDETAILRNIAEAAPLTKLARLTLRGFQTTAEDCSRLLRNSPQLQSVDLRAITLRTLSWRPTFDHLTSKSNKLTRLRFYDLFEQRGYVCFADVPSCLGRYNQSTDHPSIYIPGVDRVDDNLNVFAREGRDEILRGIDYTTNERWPLGCIEQHWWQQDRLREYGPPDPLGRRA